MALNNTSYRKKGLLRWTMLTEKSRWPFPQNSYVISIDEIFSHPIYVKQNEIIFTASPIAVFKFDQNSNSNL